MKKNIISLEDKHMLLVQLTLSLAIIFISYGLIQQKNVLDLDANIIADITDPQIIDANGDANESIVVHQENYIEESEASIPDEGLLVDNEAITRDWVDINNGDETNEAIHTVGDSTSHKEDMAELAEGPTKGSKPTEVKADILRQDLNPYVLEKIKTYQIGGYPYLLNNDYANYNGVTVDLHYQNRLLLRAHPSGNRASHCSGITFEVFFKAMEQRNKEAGLVKDDFNGMTYDELYDFLLIWYVANSNKTTNNMAIAMEKYGVGRRIHHFEDAKAGDFLDFSRENNTGHTVVFLNWIRDNGRIVGLRYWSSQGSTNGINYKEEYFNVRKSDGTKYGNLMIDQVYIGRVGSINDYR